MNELEKQKMLELLSDKAIFGLSEQELADFAEFEKNFPELNDDSLESTAAKIGMINLDTSEQLPAHLRTKIIADADKYFASRKEFAAPEKPEEFQKTFAFAPKSSILQWLGWAVAGLACVALAVTLWTTRQNPTDIAKNTPTPTITPKIELTPAQEREQLLASAKDAVQTNWSDFNPKEPKNVQGDVVWSNSLQKGFVRFRNLPANDKTKETYQVWIFDKSQKNPVSGGVFDVGKDGEIIVPIDSALKIQEPAMVGITVEKPGGVVVSDLKKVMAVAKFSA
jgi:Anti-sigma-K factor rskA